MASRKRLEERRVALATLIAQGSLVTHAIETVAEQYGFAENTIWKDWMSKDEWMPEILRFHRNIEGQMFEHLHEQAVIKLELWRLYGEEGSKGQEEDDQRVPSLRAMTSILDRISAVAERLVHTKQTFGMLPKEPKTFLV